MTMQEIIIEQNGGPDVLKFVETAPKALSDHEVRIKNTAIGINFIDIYQREGLYKVDLPFTPGKEGAGTIEEVGKAIQGLKVGDRVAYLANNGGYASEIVVPADKCAVLPDGISDDQAAASFLKGLTVQMLIRQIFPLKAGDTALVYAAAGGVGNLLCQWANHLGAHVIGVVGNEEKVASAKAAGAKDVINRNSETDFISTVRTLTDGTGVDVVYDSIGAKTFEQSLDCLAPRGMMVTYGNASGPVAPFAPLELAKRGSLSLIRPILFDFATPEAFPGMAKELFAVMAAGKVTPPPPTTFPLANASDAQTLLAGGNTTGAIVLKP